MIFNEETERVVITQGSFDDLRTKDIRFLQEASKLGNLQVILFADKIVREISGESLKYPLTERTYYLENIQYVDKISVSDCAHADSIDIPENITPENIIWAIRERDANDEKESFCKNSGIRYLVIRDDELAGFPLDVVDGNIGNKKVMVSGCFDWVHTGHVRFFEEASEFGDLYVVVGHDANLLLLKGAGHPLFPEKERQYWVQSIRFVKRALISTGHGWLDAKPEIERLRPDFFIVNHDGDKPEKRALFKELGIEYKVLTRKPKPGLPARLSTTLRGF